MGSITTVPGTIPTSSTIGVPFSYQFSAGTYTAAGPTTTPSYTASWTTEYEDPSYTITSYYQTVWGDGNDVYIGYNGFATFTIQPAFQYTADQLKSINGVITIEWGDSLNVTSTNAYFTLPDISGSTQYPLRQGSVTNMTFTFSAGGTRIVKPTIVFYAGDLAGQGGVIWGFNNIVFTIATPIVPGVSTTYQSIFSPPVSVPTNYFLNNQSFTNPYTLTLASPNGLRSVPSPNPATITLQTTKTDGVTVLTTKTYSISAVIPTINVTPAIGAIVYPNQSFGYTFYTSSTVDVLLSPTPGSDLIALYGDSGSTLTFSSTGYPTAGVYTLSVDMYVDLTKIKTTLFTFAILPTPPISTSGLASVLYKYEPFSMLFSLPSPTTLTLQYSNSSSGLQPFFSRPSTTSVLLSGTFQTTTTTPYSLVVTALDSFGSTFSTISLSISVSNGRFYPPTSNQNYQIYQYENISNTFGSNPIFSSSLKIDTIFSLPSLPIGLSFSNADSNTYYLKGTPSISGSQSNYQIFGSNSTNGKIISTAISIKVNGQLVRISPVNAMISAMEVGTPITPITFTSALPTTIYAYSFFYAWDTLPDGLVFLDASSNVVTSGSKPTDSNLTVILSGTPTTAGAALLGTSPMYYVRLVGTRTDQTGTQIKGNALIGFSFSETLLITSTVSTTLYESLPLAVSDVTLTPTTYFYTGLYPTIASFVPSSLPDGLSLTNSGSTYYLTGTPTGPSSNTYSFTATNTNGKSRTVQLTIPINADVPTFISPTPASGTAITLIISRPIALTYTSGIVFSATSQLTSTTYPISYSASIDFTAYGLTFSKVGTTYQLSGTPTSTLSTQSVVITATDRIGKTVTTTINFTITQDTFTWPSYSPAYYQNRAITPFQINVSTASGRAIQLFSSTDMPPGLLVSSSGVISGTPTGETGGTFSIFATTGYVSPTTATQTYTYTMTKDNILTVQLNSTDQISTIFSNIYFKSIVYSSDMVVSPTYTLSMYPLQYPTPTLSISSNGNFSGNFTGVSPYSTYILDVTTAYGTVTTTTPGLICLTFDNVPTPNLAIAYSFGGSNYIANTSSYVYQGTTLAAKLSNAQTWTDSGIPPAVVNSSVSADVSSIGSNFVALTGYGLYDGTYNLATRSIVWNTQTPTIVYTGLAVGNDGGNNWLAITSGGGVGFLNQLTKTTGGSWTLTSVAVGRSSGITIAGQSVIKYASPNFILANGTNIIYSNVGTDISWNVSSFSGFTVSNIGVSNTTLVAVGGTVTSGSPISTSTNNGQSWSRVSITSPSNLIYSAGSPVFNDIVYAGGTWVMCGVDNASSNFVAYTTDSTLTTWNLYTPAVNWSLNTKWYSINFNGNAWELGGLYDSNNGSTGTKASRLLTVNGASWPPTAYSIFSNTIFSNSGTIGSGSVYSGIARPNRFVSSLFSNSAAVPQLAFIPATSGLSFTSPTQSNFILYQYVPYSFEFDAIPTTSFLYYYSTDLPIGFAFTLDSVGKVATLSGIPPTTTTQTVTVYVKTATSTAIKYTVILQTVIPFFVNPQVGAGAYTALLRNEVEANAAQNSRDNKTYPQVDALAGPFMGPRAPDVVTASNCILNLCKKPCPNCHS